MSKRVLMFSCDPGGANTIVPIARPLMDKNYEVLLFGKDAALNKYRNSNISGIDITNIIGDIDIASIEGFLKEESPDFIITGTSVNDMVERLIWKTSDNLGIYSFAILDQWINYGIRFSKYGVSELDQYNRDKTHPYLPTKILVMDEYAYNEAIEDGIEASKMIITGQPHFEQILQWKNNVSSTGLNALKENLNIAEKNFIVTYASEPITKDYKEKNGSVYYWGYNEKTIFSEIYEALARIQPSLRASITLIIKLHPREDYDSYEHFLNKNRNNQIKTIVDKETNPWDLMLISDLVCGMSSMFLLEAVILSRPAISVQIGLNKENPFILDRRGILKSILNREALYNEIKRGLMSNHSLNIKFDFIKNPVSNIIFQMEEFLC